jgi:hypothetical protein
VRGRVRVRVRGSSAGRGQRTIWGISGWDTSTALATTANFGIAGSATTGVSVVLAFYPLGVPSAINRLAQRFGSNQGWFLNSNSVGGLQSSIGTGAAQVNSPIYQLTAADVGKIHVMALSMDMTTVRLYMDRADIGGTSATAYTPRTSATTNVTVMGSSNTGSNAATQFAFLGMAGRDTALTLADFQTICDATKAAGALSLGGISMSHAWYSPQGGSMPSTLTDDISASASDDMTFTAGSAGNLDITRVSDAWAY